MEKFNFCSRNGNKFSRKMCYSKNRGSTLTYYNYFSFLPFISFPLIYGENPAPVAGFLLCPSCPLA